MIEQAKERYAHKDHTFTIEEVQGEVSTDLVPVTSSEVSLVGALHTSKVFATSARYGSEEGSVPRSLSWATGNNDCFAANGKTPLPAARGWIIDKPDEDEMFPADWALVDAMEVLCEQGLALECVVVRQDRETGKPRRVPSWHLPVASLFVVCDGIPSRSKMDADPTWRWGVAYGWTPGQDGRSQLRFRCFIKELMEAGCDTCFTASFSSHCTDKAIDTLRAQEDVLKFVDRLRANAGEKDLLPFYAYALPIKCSTKTKTAGKAPTTTEIYYPVPAIPRLSQRDPQGALAYLTDMAITDSQLDIVQYDGRVEQAIEWSVTESRKVMRGQMDEEEAAPIPPREPSSVDNDEPF